MSEEGTTNSSKKPNKAGRKKGSKNLKRTKMEVEQFIQESTEKILREHLSWTEYVDWCKTEGLGAKRCNEYWKLCWDRVKEKFSLEKDQHIHKHLHHYWDLYNEANNKGDLTNARQVLNDVVKLMGLAEPDKMELNTKGEITFKFGDE